MIKTADALMATGYEVTIVSPIYSGSMMERDLKFLQSSAILGAPYNFVRQKHPLRYYYTSLRRFLARRRVTGADLTKLSLVDLGTANTRAYRELLALALTQDVDLYIGGTSTGLAVAAEAGRRRGVPYGLDLEDFHTGELHTSVESDLTRRVTAEIETRILPKAAFLTVASEAIRLEYERTYLIHAHTINNVFPLPDREPDVSLASDGRLRLLWVSQVIGPDRGIESAIHAMAEANLPATLTLIGDPLGDYLPRVTALASAFAPKLEIIHRWPSYRPENQQHVIDLCRGYDVGLTLEQATPLNRALCLCNKPFTYLPAGCAVAFTDTPGQKRFAEALGPASLLFNIGDHEGFGRGLRSWALEPSRLVESKLAAWRAAKSRWHWEHQAERGKLLGLVHGALNRTNTL